MRSDLRARIRTEWKVKAALSFVLPLYFCIFYFGIQKISPFGAATLRPLPVDEAIRFDPDWILVYQSIYLLLPVPWLCASAADLRRYVTGFLFLTAVAFLIFVFAPVSGPRPSIAPDHALYSLVVRYDSNENAFPSLHVALTVYSLLLAARLVRGKAALMFLIVWTALIIYSTMATKQHWAADAAAGIVLALAADLFAGCRIRKERNDANEPSPRWIDAPSPGEPPLSGSGR